MSEGNIMEKVVRFMHKFLGNDSEFKDKELEMYKLALTHSSNNSPFNHNQRLAFIGDSVLRLIIREHLYNKYPNWTKGQLSDTAKGTDKTIGIEQNKKYAKIAIKLNVLEYMDIQNQSFESDSTITNAETFEALFGAVYLTRGLEEARQLAEKYVLNK
ncbi:MAG TPA: hypothetical protein C5S50_01035 [Methanosarcinaceae archaeon]|nr:hypothetical protein [Methanosarcinaceae archaeon]